MGSMKYIIIKHNGHEVPIMFSSLIEHQQFAYLQPIAAGFVDIYIDSEGNQEVDCWGEICIFRVTS